MSKFSRYHFQRTYLTFLKKYKNRATSYPHPFDL